MFSFCLVLELTIFLLLQYETYSIIIVRKSGTAVELKLFGEETIGTEESVSVWKAYGKVPGGSANLPVQISIASEDKEHVLENEWEIYHTLGAISSLGDSPETKATEAGICRAFFKGRVVSGNQEINGKLALVTESLGENLMAYATGRRLDTLEWTRIAHGMMKSVAYLHTFDIRHGNITPENFRFALRDSYDTLRQRNTKVYLTGFGKAQVEPWQIPQTGFCANTHFCSTQTHHLIELSASTFISTINERYKKYGQDSKCKDDIEPVAYCIYFIKYGLPWFPKLNSSNKYPIADGENVKYENIAVKKVAEMKDQFPETLAETFKLEDGKISRTGAILVAMIKHSRFVPQGALIMNEIDFLRGWKSVVLWLAAKKKAEQTRLQNQATQGRALEGLAQSSSKTASCEVAMAGENNPGLEIINTDNTEIAAVGGGVLANSERTIPSNRSETQNTEIEKKLEDGKNLKEEDEKEKEITRTKNTNGNEEIEIGQGSEIPNSEIQNKTDDPFGLVEDNKFQGSQVTCRKDGFDDKVSCSIESDDVKLVVASNAKKYDKAAKARTCICLRL